MGLGSGRSGPWARPLLLRPPLPGGDEWTKCQDERPLSLCGGLQGDDEEPTRLDFQVGSKCKFKG